MALRLKYGGLDPARICRSCRHRRGARPLALRETPPGGSSSSCRRTRRCWRSAASLAKRGGAAPVLGGAVVNLSIRLAHLYPKLTEPLRRPRQHHLPASGAVRRAASSSTVDELDLGDALDPASLRPHLHRRRPGPRAGARRRGPHRREGRRRSRRRSRAAWPCWRSAAATSCFGRYYRDRRRRGPARPGHLRPAYDPRRAKTDDRGRPPRVRARARRAADDRRVRKPRRPHDPRPRRPAARPRRLRARERRRERLRGHPARRRARDVPPRAAPPAQSVARGLADRAGAAPRRRRDRRSIRCRTTWSEARTRSRWSAPRTAADASVSAPRARRGTPSGRPAPSA